ncbi:MAG: STN and carboxypeptidase regulatory-like domain-containing protein [Bacteroidia bacterium]|nr:STN and carboxypeptidase regulatory-like domain-containing protein [Bacteroidia bacterium]
MKLSKSCIVLIILLLFPVAPWAAAQTNHLEKKISINLNQVKLKDALPKIGESGGFQFSYNSEIIPGDSLVSIHTKDLSVNQILGDLFGPGIRYKVLGNHIILLNDSPIKKVDKRRRNQEYTIRGYIYDAQTGEIISAASIYEVEGMFVSATDSKGFYSLTVPGERENQLLSYSKAGYADTLIIVKPKEQVSLNISLNPKHRKQTENQLSGLPVAGLNERTLVKALVPAKTRVAADNIPVIEQRWAQLSLFPFVGSNRFISGLITNRLSLNIFAGYAGGVRGLELGGLLNVVRNEMHGVQISGLGNIVGERSKGIQMSGIFNVDAGSFIGLQAAGFSNVVTDTIRGVQLAGFSNVLRGPMNGTQVSGFSNFTSQNVDGIQAAGFMNVALKANKGLQVAGFLNYAREVQGLQLSVFNIADTVSSGLPIGLLSFIAKGYHTFEVTANEFFPLNVSFKTGIRHFYNILTAGWQQNWLSVGYGLGTQVRLAKRLTLSMDFTGYYISDNTNFIDYKGALVRFSSTLDIELARHLKFIFGPTLNGFSSQDPADLGSSTLPVLFSLPIDSQMVFTTPVSIWIGATAGFRF